MVSIERATIFIAFIDKFFEESLDFAETIILNNTFDTKREFWVKLFIPFLPKLYGFQKNVSNKKLYFYNQ